MSPGCCATPEELQSAAHNGGARSGSRAPSIPRCGVSSPFRGHLSTKSNAFCIGHSSRLSDQYRIRDNMLSHYNKILSAKAAVDCSIPKSMVKSIKYSDQQRRESMKKEIARLERTSSHSAASTRPRSRDGADSAIHWKDTYDPPSYLLRHSPYSDPGPIYSPSSLTSLPRHLRSPAPTGELHRRHPEFSRLHCGLSTSTAWSSPCKFQDSQTKTYSGDLLEKHSHYFTNKERPFTPRTLKTQAKSALAQSRYYTPPRRKRKGTATEAETQTDISSFQHSSQTEAEKRASQLVRDQEGNNETRQMSDDDAETAEPQQLSFSRSSDFKSPSPTLQKIHSEEQELAYLKFVADVTNEILTLGLFSDRVLHRVFQRHLEENRYRLDERKMWHLLDILRIDLNCKEEDNPKSTVNNYAGTRGAFSSSPWDKVMNVRSQEAASLYLGGLFSCQHLPVLAVPYTDTKDSKHQLPGDALSTTCNELEDYVQGGTDEYDHHREASAQTNQGDRGDHSLSPLDGRGPEDNRGSPAHDNLRCLLQHPEDNLLFNITDKDETSDDKLDNLPLSSNISKKTDLETLEDLQQSFSDVIQVSREDGISDVREGRIAETNQIDF